MQARSAGLMETGVSCLCFNILGPVEERFFLGYERCVVKRMYELEQ